MPGWKKFLAQFADVLVILLLIATTISAALCLVERKSSLPYEAMAILADARLIHSTALQTAEAVLTGESQPVSKDMAPVAGEVGPVARLEKGGTTCISTLLGAHPKR